METKERVAVPSPERAEAPAKNEAKGAVMIILAGMFWGTLGLFIRFLNAAGLHSMQLVELRAVFTAVIVIAALAFTRRDLLKFRLRDWWCFAGTGIAGTILFNACYFATIERVSLAVAATLMYTAPIFVTLFSVVLFGEKLTPKKVLCLALAFAGCGLVSGIASDTPAMDLAGFGIGILSGLGYGFYTLFARYALLRGYHSLTLLVYTYVFAGVAGAFITDFDPVVTAFRTEGIPVLLVLLGVVLFTTIIPNLLYFLGLPHMENGKAAVLASTEPVTAAIIGLIMYSEVPSVSAAIGMVLVIAALTWLNIEPKKS